MESSTSSDEEYCQVEFWNNWSPCQTLKKICSNENRNWRDSTKKIVFNATTQTSISSYAEKPKFGNWIPPQILLNDSKTKFTSKVAEKRTKKKVNLNENEKEQISKETQKIKSRNYSTRIAWKKEINLDWGERVPLHDVTKFSDGVTVWGLVNPGLFGKIKLWVNQYGNICGSADGKISKPTSSEMTYISIKNTHLLRKMLNLSNAQWVSLCEIVQETKTILKFDAFENFEMTKKNHLEKLWYFTCKRRHFFSCQCMLVKLSGAVKCLKQFEIIPKLLVLDIRNIFGEPIL